MLFPRFPRDGGPSCTAHAPDSSRAGGRSSKRSPKTHTFLCDPARSYIKCESSSPDAHSHSGSAHPVERQTWSLGEQHHFGCSRPGPFSGTRSIYTRTSHKQCPRSWAGDSTGKFRQRSDSHAPSRLPEGDLLANGLQNAQPPRAGARRCSPVTGGPVTSVTATTSVSSLTGRPPRCSAAARTSVIAKAASPRDARDFHKHRAGSAGPALPRLDARTSTRSGVHREPRPPAPAHAASRNTPELGPRSAEGTAAIYIPVHRPSEQPRARTCGPPGPRPAAREILRRSSLSAAGAGPRPAPQGPTEPPGPGPES